MPRIRALGLLSGGLDSALAARLLLDQGIDVVGLHLESPTACRTGVRGLAAELGIRLEMRDKGREYLSLLRTPRHGYGRNMNPCVDCRIFMFQRARPCLEELGAHFLFTGEVLGQRPMSQTASAIALIDRRAGLEGRVLRPLSARCLAETKPERLGWVDRTRLLAIRGRARHEQLALAARLGLRHHGAPGGGCRLTDPAYARRMRALFERVPDAAMDERDVALLALGRHVHARADLTLIVGRDAAENDVLQCGVDARRWLVEPDGFKGPAVLACGPFDPDARGLALAALAAYAPGAASGRTVRVRHARGEESVVLGADGADAPTWRERALPEAVPPHPNRSAGALPAAWPTTLLPLEAIQHELRPPVRR